MRNTVALIMARGGSKGLPRKNLHLVAGKPLITHTFEAALESQAFTRIILSTDSAEIAQLGRKHGISVPFMRPKALASDKAKVIDASIHALDWIREHETCDAEYAMLLQPTSPLRTSYDIKMVIKKACQKNAKAVVSVTQTEHHPCLSKSIDKNGIISNYTETDKSESRRQDLDEAFSLNGAIYFAETTCLREQRTWCPKEAVAYIMPPERSIDIDSEWDMRLASLIMENINGKVR